MKRMSQCNGVDMSLNVTQHASEQTSDWSLMVREYVESF
jgi:hypothetical protein